MQFGCTQRPYTTSDHSVIGRIGKKLIIVFKLSAIKHLFFLTKDHNWKTEKYTTTDTDPQRNGSARALMPTELTFITDLILKYK